MPAQVSGYKYIVNVEGAGWACADRLPALLTSDSVVLKQASRNVEWWYALLQPWVHYVPVDAHWADLREPSALGGDALGHAVPLAEAAEARAEVGPVGVDGDVVDPRAEQHAEPLVKRRVDHPYESLAICDCRHRWPGA